jgi:hypothetical protein
MFARILRPARNARHLTPADIIERERDVLRLRQREVELPEVSPTIRYYGKRNTIISFAVSF